MLAGLQIQNSYVKIIYCSYEYTKCTNILKSEISEYTVNTNQETKY